MAVLPAGGAVFQSVISGLSVCKGPAASVKGCANVVNKSLPEKTLDRIMDQILTNWSSLYICILELCNYSSHHYIQKEE